MERDETPAVETAQMDIEVHYSHAYLVDEDDDCYPDGMLDDSPTHPVGIIRVEKGIAFLVTGLHTGTVSFTVAVADQDPGADLEGYEDIVEISFESPSGYISLYESGVQAFTASLRYPLPRDVSLPVSRTWNGRRPGREFFRCGDRSLPPPNLASVTP
ncbi:hypothetical protein ACFQX6_41385 [Streptosporangium lutulentum]